MAGAEWEKGMRGDGIRRFRHCSSRALCTPTRKLAVRLSEVRSHWKVLSREIWFGFFKIRVSLATVFKGEEKGKGRGDPLGTYCNNRAERRWCLGSAGSGHCETHWQYLEGEAARTSSEIWCHEKEEPDVWPEQWKGWNYNRLRCRKTEEKAGSGVEGKTGSSVLDMPRPKCI